MPITGFRVSNFALPLKAASMGLGLLITEGNFELSYLLTTTLLNLPSLDTIISRLSWILLLKDIFADLNCPQYHFLPCQRLLDSPNEPDRAADQTKHPYEIQREV